MDCARCGRKFSLHSPINALWCDHDQYFICRRCAVGGGRHQPMRCPHCNHTVSSSIPALMVVAIMIIVMVLPLGAISYVNAGYRAGLAATPQEPISNLSAGETVMVYGTIATYAHSPTLNAIWISTGKSGYWRWTSYPFQLYQGSNQISVTVSNLGNSVYSAPYETNTGEWYEPGDSIAVIGVISGSNGSWQLDAQHAAASPGDFKDALGAILGPVCLGLTAVGVGLIGVAWLIGIRRYRAHLARERQPGMYDYRPPVNPPPPPVSEPLPS